MASPTIQMSASAEKPTRARYWVIVFAVTLAILAYIDRVCISQAAPLISRDLGFDKSQMGAIFGAFGLAYAFFEIPGGWMGDWMGPRKVLMRIVIWWSFFTAITGMMKNFTSLWIARFLFGAGEAGCFPNLTKAFSVWLPTEERVRAQGIMWTFARWGGAFTPPLVVAVLAYVDWRTAFIIFGCLGAVWAVLFYWWFRDNPKDHPSVNKAELELLKYASQNAGSHGNVPWGLLVSNRSVWLLWLQYFLLSFPWYFYITWLPTWLQEHHKLDAKQAAFYAVGPLLLGGIGSMVSGIVSPIVARATGSTRKTRRVMACFGFLGAAIMLTISIQQQDPMPAMIFMSLASFFNDLVMPGAWAACMDVGGKYAGTLAGSMNMMGNVAGFTAPWIGGMMFQASKNATGVTDYTQFFYLMAGCYLLGTLVWPFIDPVTPLTEEGAAH